MSVSLNEISMGNSSYQERYRFCPWINKTTVKTALCFIANISLAVCKATPFLAGVVNLPMRSLSIIDALREGKIWKAGVDVLALGALFTLPYGPIVAIVMDIAVMIFDGVEKLYMSRPTTVAKKVDCTIRENALEVLGLEDIEALDAPTLDERYQDLCREFDKRITGTARSPVLTARFTMLRSQVDEAYKTLAGTC